MLCSIILEPLQKEMIVNIGRLFVERVQLFRNVPQNLVTKIAVGCKREQFLANDIVIFHDCLQ